MIPFLLIFVACLLITGSMFGILMMSRTPRYRTNPEDLLNLFDRTLAGAVGEAEWYAVVGYPASHDAYLESIRRRAQRLMDEYGRPWQAAQGGHLLSKTGREELRALRDRLATYASLSGIHLFRA